MKTFFYTLTAALLCTSAALADVARPVLQSSTTKALVDDLSTGAKKMTISSTGTLEWVNGGTLTGGSYLKSALSLNNVENTAISTWAGTANVTTLGTITTGVWQGTAITDTYISSAATWNAKESALTFSTGLSRTSNTITLATSGITAGSYGSSTQVARYTVDAYGRITAVSAQTITPAVGVITGLGTGIATWLATPTEANLKAAQSGLSWLDTAGTLSANSAVSSPTRLISGSWYSGGTGTTTLPHILIEPTGTTASTTWDTAGTGLGINGSTGTLFAVKTNGVGAGDYTPNTNFKITADGFVWFGTYKMLGANYGGCNAYGNLYYTTGAGINFLNGSNLVFNNDASFFSAPYGGSSITGVLHLNGANSTEELRISANGSASAGSYLGLKFDGTNGVISSTGIVKITAPIGLPTGTNARAGNATLVAGTVTVSNATVTTSTLVILTRKTAGGTIGGLTYTLSSGSSFTINSDSATDTSTVSFLLIENP